MSEAVTDLDRKFVAAAIRLGAQGLGTTWPNPAVGAIVVRNGVVVGRGVTRPGGRPHGEPLAIAAAGESARGSTLYVSLEPCDHQGKTPPCTDAIIAAGVARVVVPHLDPDPRVSGRGLERLRKAGIEVSCGVLEAEARRAHGGHVSRITRNRPKVLLKLAVSADDAIGRRGEKAVPVTGEIARRHVHALRSRVDSILVGRGTIAADDPLLTCRLPGLEGRSPVRVVVSDSVEKLGSEHRIFSDRSAPTWVFSTAPCAPAACLYAHVVRQGASGLVDLSDTLRILAEKGITSVLVEGGARVARSFLEADLVDEAIIFRSPNRLGGDIVPALAGLPLSVLEDSAAFRRVQRRRFGEDWMNRYERVR